MSSQNLYLLHFNGRNDNLGDQFIFRALVRALTDLGLVHIRKGVPPFIAGAAPHASGWRLGWHSARTALRGGVVYDFLPPGGRTWTVATQARASARASLRAVKRQCLDVVGGRRIAIGASVIPAANHAWCEECDWIGVRDHESLAALRAAGIRRVEYFPDLSFLPPPSSSATEVERGGLCVSFRKAVPEARDAQAYELQLSEAFGALTHQLTAEARGRSRAYYQVEEDEAFTRRLSHAHDIHFHPARVSLESFEPFYRSADLVVSNRLHCLLMGAYCGAVPVALTSRAHTKVTALFETVGWHSLILPIEEAEALPQRFAAIQQDLPRLRRIVAASFDEQRRLGLTMLAQRFGGDRIPVG